MSLRPSLIGARPATGAVVVPPPSRPRHRLRRSPLSRGAHTQWQREQTRMQPRNALDHPAAPSTLPHLNKSQGVQ
ncbi:hypothetical protein TNCT_624491 [Trichonephila clavata]|uniref:Uncharacterized protein n=1 Tax=Trichonephila clavata TaxID=2740835 RepID=A0A8X6H655_TRICU|nr:hypothetical protein TNCT_624491 [Trichonephila clavata]